MIYQDAWNRSAFLKPTFIHAVKDLIKLLLCIFTLMLFPAFSCLAAQDHQFSLHSSQSCEMWNLHNHWAEKWHVQLRLSTHYSVAEGFLLLLLVLYFMSAWITSYTRAKLKIYHTWITRTDRTWAEYIIHSRYFGANVNALKIIWGRSKQQSRQKSGVKKVNDINCSYVYFHTEWLQGLEP